MRFATARIEGMSRPPALMEGAPVEHAAVVFRSRLAVTWPVMSLQRQHGLLVRPC